MMKKINKNKVAFIICANDKLYLDECIVYINHLIIPKGFVIDIITIFEADSITKAYNAAMSESDAKYKVYLHQDVFVLNHNLIGDFVDIFENEAIGMIGVLAGKPFPANAKFASTGNIGKAVYCSSQCCITIDLDNDKINGVEAVAFIDGMLMITQYDVPWNEQIIDWHLYDAAQSIEMQKNGYQVVVPFQEKAWALHDAGICSVRGYDKIRKIFCNYYQDYGFVYDEKEDYSFGTIQKEFDDRKKHILFYIKNGMLDEAKIQLDAIKKIYMDTELSILCNLFQIREKELQASGKSNIFTRLPEEEIRRYHSIAFMIRRLEWDFPKDECQDLIELLLHKEISIEEVEVIAEHSILQLEKVWKELLHLCGK